MSRTHLDDPNENAVSSRKISLGIRKIERREWWLWVTAIVITLLLTAGILSFALPSLPFSVIKFDPTELTTALRGLVAMVLLFDIYTHCCPVKSRRDSVGWRVRRNWLPGRWPEERIKWAFSRKA